MTSPGKAVKTKLFIGNLDPATQPSELSELFGAFGAVLEASVIKDYGFVHFGSVEEAEKAATALNNKEFHGKRLRVELSTSTVRHRPGQPEPASALRNSRARAAAMTAGNGVSRYSPAITPGGVGPMRHSASAWVRGDTRPYDGIPMDPNAMNAGYGPPPAGYDRPRSYDARSDPRNYYNDRRDSGYGSGYDATRDNMYGAPGYPTASSGGGNNSAGGGGGPTGMYPVRDYPDLPPTHVRPDSAGYGANRMYDRNPGTSPMDPYYSGGGLPQVPPTSVDPYNYDPYQKYYANRPRDPEYPPMPPTQSSAPPREYDMYTNYRSDPYATAAAPGQPPSFRHDVSVAYPPQQHQAAYPPPTQSRQQPVYGGAPGAHPSSYAPPLAQYYGAQQRA